MGGYLVNFSVYTMAMIGLIFFALMIYKKFSGSGILNRKSEFLSVEESISIAPRKNLYVVKAGNERFLIAGDVDKTTLISKLESNNSQPQSFKNEYREMRNIPQNNFVEDLPDITNRRIRPESQSTVLHNMMRKINQ